jgi:hypothetical protein
MMIGYDIYDCFTMEPFRLRQKMTLTTKIYCSRLYDLRNDILFATMWLWVWAQRPRRLSVCLYLHIQDRYKVWQQFNISRMVSRKPLRFGKELRAFKFYSFRFFQFYTFICFRDTRIT